MWKRFNHFLDTWKPIPLCWWFEQRGKPIPRYFIGGGSTAPTVTDSAATSITKIAATGNGNITSDGGATITARGMVISVTATNSNPLIGGTGVTNIVDGGTATGAWSQSMTSLTPNTGYSYKAYATNSKGTSYGTVQTFTTNGLDTIALNSPADTATGVSTTPDLQFTGTDSDSLDITYEVQVDTVNTFDSQGNSPAFVQSKSAHVASTTTPSITLNSAPTSGNLLVMFVSASASGITFTFTGWTQLTASANRSSSLWYKISDGSETTITGSCGFAQVGLAVSEYSGIATSSPLDVENAQDVASGTTFATPSVTPSSGVKRLIVFAATIGFATGSWSNETINSSTTGVTEREDNNGSSPSIHLSDKIVSSTSGSYSGSADWSGSAATGGGHIAIFKSGTAPLIDATSASGGHDAAQFSGSPDNTDPFASGQAVTFTVPANLVVDFYSEANYDGTTYSIGGSGTATAGGQAFTGDGSTLAKAKLYLKKTGSPTGNATATVYASTGTYGTNATATGSALATSDVFDVSTLTTSLAIVSFNFSGANQITLTNGTHYIVAVEYTGGDASNLINIGSDTTTGGHSGNSARKISGTWGSQNLADTPFYVLSTTGETLSASTTYYWRVRGKDPSGSNTFGSWATTRSFTTASGGGGGPGPAQPQLTGYLPLIGCGS